MDGNPTTPFEMFYGVKPCLERFKFMFYPIVFSIGPKFGNDGRVRHRRNNPERGVAGIHVGIPKNSDGWLCYIPSINNTVIFSDVVFDEHFESTHVRLTERTRVPGGIALQPHPQSVKESDQLEVVRIMTPFDQRGESEPVQLNAPSTIQNPVYFDVENPAGMDTLDWNPFSSSDYDTSD